MTTWPHLNTRTIAACRSFLHLQGSQHKAHISCVQHSACPVKVVAKVAESSLCDVLVVCRRAADLSVSLKPPLQCQLSSGPTAAGLTISSCFSAASSQWMAHLHHTKLCICQPAGLSHARHAGSAYNALTRLVCRDHGDHAHVGLMSGIHLVRDRTMLPLVSKHTILQRRVVM